MRNTPTTGGYVRHYAYSLMTRPVTGPFRPTHSSVRWWFHTLNRELFNGELPAAQFKAHNDPDSWGYYIAPELIAYSRAYRTKQHFVAVLAHEMVHHWQAHNGLGNHCHGASFVQWIRRFRRHGIVLAEHGDVHMC